MKAAHLGSRPAPAVPALPQARVAAIRDALLAWYRREGRDLPWRRTRDPYAVLVSEMMLQQQQVDRVVPVYRAFLARFPTLAALAAGPRADALRIWSAIGLNAHALRLYDIARWAAAENAGRLPDTVDGLRALKGIGPYTAGAVACFAHGQAAPLVDTNVRRVLGRLFSADAPGALENDRLAWQLAAAALPEGDAYDWNQALLDLGALVCTARVPRCGACPVRPWCGWQAAPAPAAPEVDGQASFSYANSSPAGGRLVAETRAAYDATGAAALSPEAALPAAPVGAVGAVGAVAPPHELDAAAVRPAGAPAKRRAPRRYQGTRRWARGRTMRALSALPPGARAPLADLARDLKPEYGDGDLPWFLDVARSLAKDGLIDLREAAGEGYTLGLPD